MKNKTLDLEQLEKWIKEEHRCKVCGNIMTTYFGSGIYCSKKCANTRKHSKAVKLKISASVKENYKRKRFVIIICKLIKEILKRLYYLLHSKRCRWCNNYIPYSRRKRQTCSNDCATHLRNHDNNITKTKPKLKYVNREWNDEALEKIYNYYFIYKTINLINGKYYIGMHATNDLNDGYLGSGVALNKAIKKYGKENFKREILEYFNCYKDVAEAEYKYITEETVKDKNSYNLTIGGIGGPTFKGKNHSEESKKKIWETRRKKINNML